jgi:hypothetical protein
VKEILDPMNTAQKERKRRNKAIPDTGLGGILSCETSTLSRFLNNPFIVGG